MGNTCSSHRATEKVKPAIEIKADKIRDALLAFARAENRDSNKNIHDTRKYIQKHKKDCKDIVKKYGVGNQYLLDPYEEGGYSKFSKIYEEYLEKLLGQNILFADNETTLL